MVAVGGDSGTGKATLCEGMRAIFGEDRCAEVRLDGYLALSRVQRNTVALTPLDPRTYDFAAMDDDLWQLAHGTAIVKPVYDHHLGAIRGMETVEPREIVLVHGTFPLFTRVLRSFFDVSVWLEPERDLKIAWMIDRNITERGYREEQVRAEIERRAEDYERYIAPQAQYADILARFSASGVTFIKSGRLAPLDYGDFASRATHMRLVTDGPGPYPGTIIEVDADIDEATARAVEDELWKRIGARHASTRPATLGAYTDRDGEHRSHPLALAQLLLARRIGLVADELSRAAAV